MRDLRLDMTTDALPTGPDPEAITRTILETWPETDMVEALGARFFSLDPGEALPQLRDDRHDRRARRRRAVEPVAAGRLPAEHRRRARDVRAARRLDGREPDYAAFDRIVPHPVYAKQLWISILNPSDATFRDVVMPLLTEAHDRLAATRARHADTTA